MDFIKHILGFGKKQVNKKLKNPGNFNEQPAPQNEMAIKLLDFKTMMDSLLREKRYIAKSDYADKIKEYEKVIESFNVLQSTGMIENFCICNNVSDFMSCHQIAHIS